MERLTDEKKIGPFAALKDEAEYDSYYAHMIAVTRLKEYEDAMTIERAQELARAEKDGRLVVLPCKPGQPIWVESCIHGRVTCIDTPDIVWIIENMERFGTEIFLTREEAEAALKKREAGQGDTD